MMRPLYPGEVVFNEIQPPRLGFIKKPTKKKKQKGWHSYYDWWLSKQRVEVWMNIHDCSFPFARNTFDVSIISDPTTWS